MYRGEPMKKNVMLLWALAAITVSTVGCKHRPKPDALSEKINTVCTIYFSGMAHEPGSSGAVTGLSGQLLKVTPEWIVLSTNVSHDANNVVMEKYWVPRSAVLYVRTQN
jgi:hypothetical protein